MSITEKVNFLMLTSEKTCINIHAITTDSEQIEK